MMQRHLTILVVGIFAVVFACGCNAQYKDDSAADPTADKIQRFVIGDPVDVDDANDNRRRRKRNHLYAILQTFNKKYQRTLPPWAATASIDAKGNARTAATFIAALLTILGDPVQFQDANGTYSDYPDVEDFITQNGAATEADTLHYYQLVFENYLSTISPLDKLGTDGDYDFVLGPLINILYANKDLTHFQTGEHVLTNEMIYYVLCQNSDECLNEGKPFHSFRVGNWDLITDPLVLVYQPETENHVLMILAWNYLATTWVMWQGRIWNQNDPRFSQDMVDWRQDNFVEWMENRDYMQDLMLKVLGRVVHRGLFETNAKPYQHYSLLPIFLLTNYSVMPVDPDVPQFTETVQKAAHNAFLYIATKYTFQSLKEKRIAPMRRNDEYRYSMGFYTNNSLPTIFGMLSGTYDYNDCINDQVTECVYGNWKTSINSQLMPVTLSSYVFPSSIHGFFVEKPSPFFARMQAKYYRNDYEIPDILFPDAIDPPAYIESPGGEFKGRPELYFGTNDMLLTAGGMHADYYSGHAGKLKKYHFWAKPTTLMFRGDYGHSWDHSGSGNKTLIADLSAVAKNILLMRGQQNSWAGSYCNIWVYKNFAYGYRFQDKRKITGKEWHLGWPQDFPKWWDFYLEEEFPIDGTGFRIYSFPANILGTPSEPYYLIMSKLRKNAAKWPHNRFLWKYQRGFVEIVPAWMYNSASQLRITLETLNPPSNFRADDKHAPYHYVMASTLERLKLHSAMATNPNQRHDCIVGIMEIAPYNGVDWTPLTDAQFEERFIPSVVGKPEHLEDIPLITVFEIDDTSWMHTGNKLVETIDDGVIVVRRRVPFCAQWFYGTNPATCVTWVDGWRCLKIDSGDYKNPELYQIDTANYADCWVP